MKEDHQGFTDSVYSQLRELEPMLNPPKDAASSAQPHPSVPLMASILREFRDDELEHLDIAVEEGAQKRRDIVC